VGALNLPRRDKEGLPYLSYSQYTTWKKSKRDYMRQYFLGFRFKGNAYTEFGTKVGEALENNDFSEFTNKEAKFLKTVPRYDVFEYEVKLPMDGFYILGYIDTLSQDNKKIADYKTGSVATKEAEYASEDYHQLHIYAGGIKHDFGKLPEQADVYLIDRKGNAFMNEDLVLGEEYKTVPKNIEQSEVDFVLAKVQKAAEEISKYYTLYQKICQDLKVKEVKHNNSGTPSTTDGSEEVRSRTGRRTTTKR